MVIKVTFENLNNNDTEHEIIFKNITCYAGDFARITVLFDGVIYKVPVRSDADGNLYFRHCGKDYGFSFTLKA